MDATVVLAVALGLGSLLLWSLLILVEDMADARRKTSGGMRERLAPPREPDRRIPEPRRPARTRDVVPPPSTYDPRFEQLVDQWFGPEGD